MEDIIDILDCLLIWIKTFKVEAPHSTAEDLYDGVVLAQVLAQIEPDYFSLNLKTGDDWRLKLSNLKKVLNGILDNNSEMSLGLKINDFQIPNVEAMAKKQDAIQLALLLKLVLACAVSCANKSVYIEGIDILEHNVKLALKNVIEELIPSEEAPHTDLDLNQQAIYDDCQRKEARFRELQNQFEIAQEEKESKMLEVEKLLEKLNDFGNLEDPSTPAGRRHQGVIRKRDILQGEVFTLEAAIEEYKAKAECQEKEIRDLRVKNKLHVDNNRELTDQNDILKYKTEKFYQYEDMIERFKIKLSNENDVKRSLKKLEEEKASCVKENFELLEKNALLKMQIETYRKRVREKSHLSTLETNNRLAEESIVVAESNLRDQACNTSIVADLHKQIKMFAEELELEPEQAPLPTELNAKCTSSELEERIVEVVSDLQDQAAGSTSIIPHLHEQMGMLAGQFEEPEPEFEQTETPLPTEKKELTLEEKYPLLQKPFEYGWRREIVDRNAIGKNSEDVYYWSPTKDGEKSKRMRSMREVGEHLEKVKSPKNMDIGLENFKYCKFKISNSPMETRRKAIIKEKKKKKP